MIMIRDSTVVTLNAITNNKRFQGSLIFPKFSICLRGNWNNRKFVVWHKWISIQCVLCWVEQKVCLVPLKYKKSIANVQGLMSSRPRILSLNRTNTFAFWPSYKYSIMDKHNFIVPFDGQIKEFFQEIFFCKVKEKNVFHDKKILCRKITIWRNCKLTYFWHVSNKNIKDCW